ncbi:hypothetical protein AX17_007216 [Amanita inopinata Kibby_2008]|nr:hypothetical protein AX17_007216 [Amanita inopinata Kibby_2008]
MHASSFSVAGMSTSGSAHHHHHHPNPGLSTWGSASVNPSGSLSSSYSDSRSHYQPGYLMSASQNLVSHFALQRVTSAQQGSPRADDAPIVQTKAKMNQGLVRGSASEFGMDSMFESTRKRQTLADEDAPPTSSVNDIPNEIYVDSGPAAFQPRASTFGTASPFTSRYQHRPQLPLSGPTTPSALNGPTPPTTHQPHQPPLYVIVFGYPPDRYSITVEYFKSLGDTTDPDLNTEIVNCFKIGFRDPGDAMRAVRKSGEVLGGTWMVGVKWADPAQAEALFGQLQLPLLRSTAFPDSSLQSTSPPPLPPPASGTDMAIDGPPPLTTSHFGNATPGTTTPTVGTPIKLAPSTAAFRRTTIGGAPPPPPPAAGSMMGDRMSQQYHHQQAGVRGWVPSVPGGIGSGPGPGSVWSDGRATGAGVGVASTGSTGGVGAGAGKVENRQSRGVLGQVSDLIFGW